MSEKEQNVQNATNRAKEVKKNKETAQESAKEILKSIEEDKQQLNSLSKEQRETLIKDFNKKNKGIAEIVDEKPDQDFIDQTKKDFEDYQDEYLHLSYKIADSKNALKYAEWLLDWNENHAVAPQNYWVGVIHFDDVIRGQIDDLKSGHHTDPKTKKVTDVTELIFDYGELTYVYNLMMAPIGVGLKYAKWMLDNQEIYNNILNKLGEHIDMVDLIRKKIGLLQSRWALACQGFKVNLLITKLEDLKNFDMSNSR